MRSSLFRCLFVIVVGAQLGSAHSLASEARPALQPAEGLLLQVQFAGTEALLADTNAAYLTRVAALPETAALAEQIVAKLAGLTGRFFAAGPGKATTAAATATNQVAEFPSLTARDESFRALFAELLREGLTLELRGQKEVTEFAIAAKPGSAGAERWERIWKSAATNWFGITAGEKPGGEEQKAAGEQGWSVADGRFIMKRSGDWFLVAGSKTKAASALARIQQTIMGPGLAPGSVLQGELASILLPGAIQHSAYGGFSRLKLSVTPADQSLRIRGTATYARDLPKLGSPAVVPTNLVTEPAISFTLVRNPGAWLAQGNVLLDFLPHPIPPVAFFWGGDSSPQQWSMAMPMPDTNRFETFAASLEARLKPLAEAIDCGPVLFDKQRQRLEWQGIPFFGPNVTLKESDGSRYILAEAFPAANMPPGLSPALLDRTSARADLVLYDWEFLQARLQTWIRVGQLGLMLSGHNQLGGETASAKWLDAAPKTLPEGGNTSTEITQTGPRELSLARRAPLALNSCELYWLANWLESPNFPAANFLVPVK